MSMRHARPLTSAFGLAAALATAALLQASTPGSGTIPTPDDDTLGTRHTLTYRTGSFAAGSLAGTEVRDTVRICTQAVTPPAVCDVFSVSLDLPSGYWSARRGTLVASVKWADAPDGNDLDLYIVDEQDAIVGSGTTDNTVSASETATLVNPGTGPRTYRVVVVNWLTTTPIDSASGVVTFNLVPQTPPPPPPPPEAPPYAPRFFDYKPPSGLGENAGEPTLGVNFRTGNVMYIAMLETLRASFDDRSSPAGASWANRSFLTTSIETFDPILFTDSTTGRTFVSQLLPTKASLSAFTSDDGERWDISQGAGINSGVDHQTIGGGRLPPGLTSIALDGYPHAVYYASQDVAAAEFALSLDGGRTYGPAVPMYTIGSCAGLHGHIKVSPVDGAVYVPLGNCGLQDLAGEGAQAAAASYDGGLTWSLSRIPGSKSSTWDPSIGVSRGGVVYFGYGDNGDRTPRVAVSRDRGRTWTVGPPLGAEHSIRRIAFPAVVAGDDGRAAFAFLGTRDEGEALSSGATFEGTWQLYVSTTYDGGATWVTVNATGEDPVQRGNVCDAGTSCPGSPNTRNLLDFMDVQIDAKGRILVAYADGCVTAACVAGVDRSGDGFLDARDNDAEDKAALARQSGGLGLLAEFDPPVPSVPAAPRLSAALQGSWAFLAWSTPDDGGASITGYRIYRDGSPVATVDADANGYEDGSTAAGTRYEVSALNALGEGARSPAAVPAVPVSGCAVPGLLVADDQVDAPPNAPLQPAVDVRTIHAAEPYGDGSGALHFTIGTGGSVLPPSSQWYLIWQRTAPDETHDRNYVAMKTDLAGRASFEHGRVSYPVSTGGPQANQGNVPTRVGTASGSYDPGGAIHIVVPTASVDNVGPGATLLGVEARTFLGRSDALPINQNLASDFSPAGSYALVGNAACKQPPDAPTALKAAWKKRAVTLTWTDNSSDETGFLIERSTSAGDGYVEVAQASGNATTFVDATAIRKTTYFYRVRAANGAARSAYSNAASVRTR
jgi:hypothetical protein